MRAQADEGTDEVTDEGIDEGTDEDTGRFLVDVVLMRR